MQNFLRFFLKINLLGLFWLPLWLFGQDSEQALASADALYKRGSYTEAYQIYEKILLEQRSFTPTMLLRMAHIRKSRQQPVEALYFFSLYNAYFPESIVQTEILDIADDQKFLGYKIDDWEYIILAYRKYKYIFHGLMFLLIFGGVAWLYYRQHHQKDSLYQSILLNLFIASYFYVYNYALSYPKGIVKTDKVVVMESPSAAAKILNNVSRGSCLKILDKNDIWYKVTWQDKDESFTGYVRENNLYFIP